MYLKMLKLFDSETNGVNIYDISNYFENKTTVDIKTEDVFVINEIISDKMANWIVYESEKYALQNGGYTTKRHFNYPTTDLPIREIPNIGNIVYTFVNIEILPIIAEKYNLFLYNLYINDLFIVKYEAGKQDELEFHKDGSFISFNILLNENSEFEGGGTIIKHEDGDKLYENKKCNLFMHSGKILHSGKKITSGKRYILVGFISYILNSSVIQYRKNQKDLSAII
jgi:hypothetical protein